jgi:hypothetical protein
MQLRIESVKSNNRRICAMRMSNSTWYLLLNNMYMLYEDGEGRSDDFCLQLSIIEYLLGENANSHIIVGGDFNVDFPGTGS